ncbi:MAG: Spy/CpxP family protein refolding chaperone [Gammaproteobacteria bacterium]|nr:Spy/CpxP family protein refolding chaperone [Gammaproteobacteria bacterium]
MKKSTKIVTATLLTLGVAGGVAAYKGDGRFSQRGWHHGEHFISHLREELDLTPEQTEALQAIRDQIWDIRQNVKQERDAQKQAFLALIEGEVLDQSQALELVTQKTELVAQYAPQVIASVAKFYDGLSQEQQAEVREHIGRRMNRRWHD